MAEYVVCSKCVEDYWMGDKITICYLAKDERKNLVWVDLSPIHKPTDRLIYDICPLHMDSPSKLVH